MLVKYDHTGAWEAYNTFEYVCKCSVQSDGRTAPVKYLYVK